MYVLKFSKIPIFHTHGFMFGSTVNLNVPEISIFDIFDSTHLSAHSHSK